VSVHGTIEVNGTRIGYWEAVRKEQYYPTNPETTGPFYEYACVFEYRDMGGYPRYAEFDIKHRFGDGAARLASRVIARGYDLAKVVGPREDV